MLLASFLKKCSYIEDFLNLWKFSNIFIMLIWKLMVEMLIPDFFTISKNLSDSLNRLKKQPYLLATLSLFLFCLCMMVSYNLVIVSSLYNVAFMVLPFKGSFLYSWPSTEKFNNSSFTSALLFLFFFMLFIFFWWFMAYKQMLEPLSLYQSGISYGVLQRETKI